MMSRITVTAHNSSPEEGRYFKVKLCGLLKMTLPLVFKVIKNVLKYGPELYEYIIDTWEWICLFMFYLDW